MNKRNKIIIFVLGLVLSLFLIQEIFVQFFPEQIFGLSYARSFFLIKNKKNDWQNLNGVQNVFIGDSTLQSALNPANFQNISINLSSDGANPIVSEIILQSYLEKRSAPKCIIFNTSYRPQLQKDEFQFDYVQNRILGLSDLGKIKKYSHFWNQNQSIFMAELYFAFTGLNFKSLFSLKFDENIQSQILYTKKMVLENSGFIYSPVEAVNDTEFYALYPKQTELVFQPVIEYDNALLKISKLAEEKKIKLIMLNLPIAQTEKSKEYIPYLQGKHQHLLNIFAPFKTVHVIQPYLTLPRENFREFSHVNIEGSKLLAEAIKTEFLECQ